MAVVEFIICKTTHQITLLRNLKIVGWTIVIQRTIPRAEIAWLVEFYDTIRVKFRTGSIAVTKVANETFWQSGRTTCNKSTSAVITENFGSVAAGALQNCFTLVIFSINRCMTASVGKSAADCNISVIARAIAFFGQAVLTTSDYAFEVLFQSEVYNTGNSIRTVNS